MKELTGTGALIRLILRRDRLLLPLWVAVVVLVPIGIAASFASLYPTAEALRAYAEESMNTPAAVAMLGLVYNPTLGGLVAWRTGLNSAILIAPVSILFVIRHTRTEEESGRRELVGSAVVGRFAPLTAALIVVAGANLVIATLIAGGLISLGLPAAGSIALGLSAASAGWVFAAVAAVAAQLTQSPGPARGIALGVFGASYVLRATGDAGGEQGALFWLSWLSPLGWVRLTRAFAGEQWWVFALFAGLIVALVAAAYMLSARRDLGAGFLPQRLGPATASPSLRSPLALAWRLHRGALLAWTAGFAAFGIGLGAVAQSISRFLEVPQLQEWAIQAGAQDAGDAYLFTIMYVLAQVVSAYALMATLRMRSEETEGRAEAVLAALGLTVGLLSGLSVGDVGGELPRLFGRTMAALPAVWVMTGIAAAAYGLVPRFAAALSWSALALFFALELAWELRQVSTSVFGLSPFAYVHWAAPITVKPLIWLTAVAAALIAPGLVGFRRRDIG